MQIKSNRVTSTRTFSLYMDGHHITLSFKGIDLNILNTKKGEIQDRQYVHVPKCHVTYHRSDVVCGAHHVTRHYTPIHNIPSTAPQLSISQKALGTLPEDGNVMPKHVGASIHN